MLCAKQTCSKCAFNHTPGGHVSTKVHIKSTTWRPCELSPGVSKVLWGDMCTGCQYSKLHNTSWYMHLRLLSSVSLVQILLPPIAPAPAASDDASEAMPAAAAEPEQSSPDVIDQSDMPDIPAPALPDLAPAEQPPAEHAVAPPRALPAPAVQAEKPATLGLFPTAPRLGAARAGLLPQLKGQVEALEDKELEMRL